MQTSPGLRSCTIISWGYFYNIVVGDWSTKYTKTNTWQGIPYFSKESRGWALHQPGDHDFDKFAITIHKFANTVDKFAITIDKFAITVDIIVQWSRNHSFHDHHCGTQRHSFHLLSGYGKKNGRVPNANQFSGIITSIKIFTFLRQSPIEEKKLISFSHVHLLHAMNLQCKQMKGFDWWHLLTEIMKEFLTQLCRKERINVDRAILWPLACVWWMIRQWNEKETKRTRKL